MGNTIKNNPPPAKITQSETGTESDFLAVLYDYPPPDVSEPIFYFGEKLRVISDEGGWWRVVSLKSGRENYIPAKCVAKVYHGWLFDGVGREKSEQLLQLPEVKSGSFMIRQSETKKGTYSLSVKHRQVKHYRIFRLPNNWYYISPRLTFQCLEHLVNHYSENADGLCCVLTTPCLTQQSVNLTEIFGRQEMPVMRRKKPFNWKSMKKVSLTAEEPDHSSETDDSFLSYGLRQSIASYLSLAEDEESYSLPSNEQNKKPNRRSCVLSSVNTRSNFMSNRASYTEGYR
ncbi:src-like-adapter isoform X2 [Rana temporaria]|uniref:src-like-adapter isoform X1 n=1 Tax=Rana temporaria TaxID=8407 RepID=UPI001AADD11D|nr:src-like-adapter isoform X1 [Rana temporaria]XP_040210924.1 src-like-adapter isoform X2 [Rana temporaria]